MPTSFAPIVIGGLYPGINRGLKADLLAAQALGGSAFPVCTSHVVAGRGTVTDVLNVPADTVSAQLEHLRTTESPTAVKIGILGSASTVDLLFQHVRELPGPVVFDVTLSGPSGEDILEQQGLDALVDHFDAADLVTIRRADAELLAGMKIPSLDDAQVAVQRIAQQGAGRVLLRCGQIATRHFDTESSPPDYSVDLYYDGDDFALFEAPFLSGIDALTGRSSGLLLPLLRRLQDGTPPEEALQAAKGIVTEALRAAQEAAPSVRTSTFYDALQEERQATPSGNGQP